MSLRRRVILGIALSAATATTAVTFSVLPSSGADQGTVLSFTNHKDSFQAVDADPAGPSAGDSYYIASHVVSGADGRTGASCWVVSDSLQLCEVDFLLSNGTITTRGLLGTLGDKVRLVVTGGTGDYAKALGHGTLTPTQDGSDVKLYLR